MGVLAVRAVAGGTLVVLFALIGEVVKPKAFSGLFSAAPSVAIASLIVTLVADDVHHARQASTGMVVGGVGMAACCVVAAVAIPQVPAVWGSPVGWVGWAGAAPGA